MRPERGNMSTWLDFDVDQTIRDFDYTKRAAASMNRIIDSAAFEEMDAEMIFSYLSREMEVVLFPDFLKRYIYEKLEIDAPFRDVPQKEYEYIISQSFEANRAPYSLTPTTTKKTAMIRLWLTQPGTRRSTIFALGFGLRMTGEEVREFLTKVLKEEGFDFTDPAETVYWYCYKNDLPYASAAKYLQMYEAMEPGVFSEKKWAAMSASPELMLLSEQNLIQYLRLLKSGSISDGLKAKAYAHFEALYGQCREIIRDMYNRDPDPAGKKKHWEAEDIRPADLEKVLCSGIPLSDKNNLKALSATRLGALFGNRKMSRQRISAITSRRQSVDRFDLITLLFFIYAQTVEPDWPAERFLRFIDGVNELLADCGMEDIYPVNPYEAFVLMCIVTEFPLDVYAQIWEMAFE